jgi:MFS transporter, DHA1 family, multidrug resistance protein
MSPALIIVALACLLSMQALSTDLYIPALPQISQALQANQAQTQWTLSSLVMALGVGQLLWGGWSDRIGRKPTLLMGLGLLVLATALTVVAQHLWVMIVGRMGQGIGVAATTVCARAMVRDLYTPKEGARILSKAMTGLGIIVLFGPVLGGFTAEHLGWRPTLALIGVLPLVWLFLTAWQVQETLPAERRSADMAWHQRIQQWRHIGKQPIFRVYTALTSSTFGGLYVFLASAAFVFIEQLGLSRPVFGIWMSTLTLSYIVGTLICQHRLKRRSLPDTVRMGSLLSTLSGLWCLAMSALTVVMPHILTPDAPAPWLPPVWLLMPGFWLYTMAHGIHQPCSQMGITAAFPSSAGAASALAGFIMSAVAFGIGAVLSAWMSQDAWAHTLHPLTLGMGGMGFVTAWVGMRWVQRHGHC